MKPTFTTQFSPAARYALIALAVVQGYALYFLQLALEHRFWPASDWQWLVALYTLVIGLPVFFYLGMERLNDKRNLLAALVLTLILGWLGWHLGWVNASAGLQSGSRFEFGAAFALSMGVVIFICALFFRAWSANGRWHFDYRQLLAYSWQQALTSGLLAMFVAVFWLLLWLCAGLFKIIGIRFFSQLFDQPAFYYPVTWLVLGLGLVMIRQRLGLVATLQFMCEALIKVLLPLAALIEVLFLLALPFTGVAPIWDTGHASLLMMLLALVLLFFFNAVLNDDAEHLPYPGLISVLILVAMALLPLCSFLSGWALWLRIDQHGLTLDRLWAGVLQLLIAGFTLGYAALVIGRRKQCLHLIPQLNKWLALLIAVVLILVNSPLADLRSWAAHSQSQRLLQGRISVTDFDYNYLRFSLGTPGVLALQSLAKSDLASHSPEAAARIALALSRQKLWEPKLEPEVAKDIRALLTVVPAGTHLPETLLHKLTQEPLSCMQANGKCLAYQVQIGNSSGWMLMNGKLFGGGAAYIRQSGKWQRIGGVDVDCRTQADRSLTRRLSATSWRRLDAPFLSYTDGRCFYTLTPNLDYLQQLQPE